MKNPEVFNRLVTVGVDMQNDFSPGGALAVDDGDKVIIPFNRVADWTRAQNGQVVLTRDWHPTVTEHFDKWPKHCVQGTEGAAFHPDLRVDKGDIIISKGVTVADNAYSAFEGEDEYGQTLEEIICEPVKPSPCNRIAIVIGGLATDYCVLETTMGAIELEETYNYWDEEHRNIGVFVLHDAIKAVNTHPEDEYNAKQHMRGNLPYDTRFVNSKDLINGKILQIEEAW